MTADKRQASAVAAASSGVGAALLATVTAACCTGPVLAPLVVAVLGAGGAAWAAGLKPFTPVILAGSAALLGLAFWMAYRRPASCEAGAAGHTAPSVVRIVVWLAAAGWIAAAGLVLWATALPLLTG